MVVLGNFADWPDWRNEKAYGYTLRLTRRGWAWEFLRRNPDFKRDLVRVLGYAERVERRSNIEVIKSPLDLTWWGLLFRRLFEK